MKLYAVKITRCSQCPHLRHLNIPSAEWLCLKARRGDFPADVFGPDAQGRFGISGVPGWCPLPDTAEVAV